MNLLQDGISNQSVMKTEYLKRLTIDNHSEDYEVYKIKLNCLYYNDQNDRIATWISQYKAENNITHLDISETEEYNNLVHKFVTESNELSIRTTQKNIELVGQQEYGVVLADGRIIDGNRRFTCLRNIQKETSQTQYFEAVILKHDIHNNAKQIKMLELMLQHGTDEKIPYNPIDKLVGVYNDIIERQLLTPEEYAKSINGKKSDVLSDMDRAVLMVEFLEFINAPKQFHLARTMNINSPLAELQKISKKCPDDDKKEDLKNIIFANILMRPEGDMTRYIRLINKIVINESTLDGYIEEQIEDADLLCNTVENYSIVNEKIIRDEIRTNQELSNKFEKATDKWSAKADGITTKNFPAKQSADALNKLEAIDVNILGKLDDQQKDNIRSCLDSIQDIIDLMRSEMDV